MIRVPRWSIRAVAVLYVLCIMTVSLLPSGKGVLHDWDQGVSWSMQKMLHVAAYAVLVALVWAAWLPARRTGYGWLLLVALMCSVFGAGLEVAQIWVPGRTASPADAARNAVGALLGVGAVVGWRLLTKGRRASWDGDAPV